MSPCLWFLIILGLIGAFGPLPTFEDLENPETKQATEIYSADSVLLGKFYLTHSTNSKQNIRN